MSEIASAFVRIRPETKGFKGQTEREVRSAFSGIGGIAAKALAAVGAFRIGKAFVEEFSQAQQVGTQLNQVIKTTGGAAHVTADQVNQLANEILRKTGIDDEAVKTTATLLLGFTNVRNEVGKGNDVFNQAVGLIEDYSVRTGKSARSATIAFGKALNDPVKGMSALTRVGIQFTDVEKKRITAMVESGKVTDAQGVILDKIRQKFGGAAEAAGTTFAGKMNILRETAKNLGAEFVERLAPTFDRFLTWVTGHLPQITATVERMADGVGRAAQRGAQLFSEHWDGIKQTVTSVWSAISPTAHRMLSFFGTDLGSQVGKSILIFGAVGRSAVKMAGTINGAMKLVSIGNPFIALVAASAAAALLIIRHWSGVKAFFSNLWVLIKNEMQQVWRDIALFMNQKALDIVEPFSHIPRALGGGPFQDLKKSLQDNLSKIQLDDVAARLIAQLRDAGDKAAKAHVIALVQGVQAANIGERLSKVTALETYITTLSNQLKAGGVTAADAFKLSYIAAAQGATPQMADVAKAAGDRIVTLMKEGLKVTPQTVSAAFLGARGQLVARGNEMVAAAGAVARQTAVSTQRGLAPIPNQTSVVFRNAGQAAQQAARAGTIPIEIIIGGAAVRAVQAAGRSIGQLPAVVRTHITAAVSAARTSAAQLPIVVKTPADATFAAVGASLGRLAASAREKAAAAVAATRSGLAPMSREGTAAATATVQGIGQALAAVGPGVRIRVGVVPGIVRSVAGPAHSAGAAISEGIVSGVLNNLGGLDAIGPIIASKISTGIEYGRTHAGSTTEEAGRDKLGKPIAVGAIAGFLLGSADLPQKVAQKITDAIEAGRTAIENSRGRISEAFSQLADDALSAFDGIQSQILTPSEAILRRMQGQDDRRQLQGALTAAAKTYKEAFNASGMFTQGQDPTQTALADFLDKIKQTDPAQIKRIADAQRDLTRAMEDRAALASDATAREREDADLRVSGAQESLTKEQSVVGSTGMTAEQVAAETAKLKAAVVARRKEINAAEAQAQREFEAAQRAIEEKRLADAAARERKQRDARVALERRHFTEDLTALTKRLSIQGTTHDVAQKRIITLLNKYHVNYRAAGKANGLAFGKGLQESAAQVEKDAEHLATVFRRKLKQTLEVDLTVTAKTAANVAR